MPSVPHLEADNVRSIVQKILTNIILTKVSLFITLYASITQPIIINVCTRVIRSIEEIYIRRKLYLGYISFEKKPRKQIKL